jgi:hypothetical protein
MERRSRIGECYHVNHYHLHDHSVVSRPASLAFARTVPIKSLSSLSHRSRTISELISSLRAEFPGSTAVFATETLSCLTAISSTGQVVSSAPKKHVTMLITETTSGEHAEVLMSVL